jgi:hypothetical protein
MTRSTRSLVSILIAAGLCALTATAAAAADYSSVNSIAGAESGSSQHYSSPNAILADDGAPVASTDTAGSTSSVNALTGGDQVAAVQPAAASSSTGDFDLGDALIGAAVGLALALATFALIEVRRRVRPRVQPTV